MLPLRDNAPSYDVPGVTLLLLVVNVFVYFVLLHDPLAAQRAVAAGGVLPHHLAPGGLPWMTLLSYMFIHRDFGQLLLNMYALWLCGDNLEWLLGHARFLLFYLLCGALAGLAAMLLPAPGALTAIGASGAVGGVLAAYVFMYPRARVTTLMPTLPYTIFSDEGGERYFALRNMSALWFVGGWLLLQLLCAVFWPGTASGANLSAAAQGAGMLAGLILVYPLAIRSRLPAADAPARADELSDALIGDEGDAGGGGLPALPLADEVERLHELHTAAGYVAPPEILFCDSHAQGLIEAGELKEALHHCRSMLAVARDESDEWRESEYLKLIDELRAQLPDEWPDPLPLSLLRAIEGRERAGL